MKEFRLPDPGEGLVEAEIVSWRVAEGDDVKINDIVVEVETSKSLVELPIPYAGTVSKLLANEGDTVDVGAPIIIVDDGTGAAPAPEPTGTGREDLVPALPEESDDEEIEAGKIGGAAPGGRVAILVGYGPKTTEAKRRPRKAAASTDRSAEAHAAVAKSFDTGQPVSRTTDVRTPMPPLEAEPTGAPLPGPGHSPAEPIAATGPVLAKPPVRKLAKDLGIDLAQVAATGEGGIITRQDVQAFADSPAEQQSVTDAAPSAPASPSDQDRRVPIKGVRKMTAQAMVESAFTAPHVTEWVTCDVTALMDLVEKLKARREFRDVKVSPLLVVAKAVCLALGRTPELNSSWDEQAQEIVLKGAVNLGIAAATPRGLMVPNVKDAAKLPLLELAGQLNELVAVAREGRTQPADYSAGSFTITNVGVFGVDAGTPILNPGEAGILCMGAISRRPWVVGTGAEERIEPRWVTTLALSFDHRLVDGEQGSRFLADVAQILSDPGTALLF
ncbi:MAG: dihydrolipoamide acetyltransferase family protein [Propionibacteriaceae bacterium]